MSNFGNQQDKQVQIPTELPQVYHFFLFILFHIF